jgi:hypothetical protein
MGSGMIKPARELAHDFLRERVTNDNCWMFVADPPPGQHSPFCSELTAAIEARDREVVEACAAKVDPLFNDDSHPCQQMLRIRAASIRSLAPLPGGTK